MSEEIKLLKCSCGGEVIHNQHGNYIYCPDCKKDFGLIDLWNNRTPLLSNGKILCIKCGQPAAFPDRVKQPFICIVCESKTTPQLDEVAKRCANRLWIEGFEKKLTVEDYIAAIAPIIKLALQEQEQESKRVLDKIIEAANHTASERDTLQSQNERMNVMLRTVKKNIEYLPNFMARGQLCQMIDETLSTLPPVGITDKERLIKDVEDNYFRTEHDMGANLNALFIWNRVRVWAGLEEIKIEDLRCYCKQCDQYHYKDQHKDAAIQVNKSKQ